MKKLLIKLQFSKENSKKTKLQANNLAADFATDLANNLETSKTAKLTLKELYAICYNFCDSWLFYLVMAAFVVGVVLAAVFAMPANFLLPLIIGAVVISVFALAFKHYNFIIIAAVLLGVFWCSADLLNLENFAVPVGRTAVLEGTVTEIAAAKDNYLSNLKNDFESTKDVGQSFVLNCKQKGGWQGKVLLHTTSYQLKVGDKIQVKAIVLPKSDLWNPALADSTYNKTQGISVSLKVAPGGIKFLELENKNKFYLAAQGIKAKLYAAMDQLPSRQQNFIKGIAFGDKVGLSGYQQQVLSQTGVMHVFAVSGSHMVYVVLFASILANLLVALFRLKSKHRFFYKFVFVILVTLFYASITGFSPSVVRSLIMSSAASYTLLQGENSNKGVLVLAAFICLFWQPLWIYDIGFQLSFLATFGIVFTTQIWRNITKSQALQVTFAAQFMVTPLIAYYFSIMTIIGFVFSPLVTLGSGVIIILVLLAMILTLFGLGDLPLYGAGILAEFMYVIAEKLSVLPGAWFAMAKPNLLEISLYFILLIFGYVLIRKFEKTSVSQGVSVDIT